MKDLQKLSTFSQLLALCIFLFSPAALASNATENLTPQVANSDVETIFCILPSNLPSLTAYRGVNFYRRWAATTESAAYLETGEVTTKYSPDWGYSSQMFSHVPGNSHDWDEVAYYFADGDWKKEISNISTLNPANIRNILKAFNKLSQSEKDKVHSVSIFQIAIYENQFAKLGSYEVLFKFNDINKKNIASFWNYFNFDNWHSYTTVACQKSNQKLISYEGGGASDILPILRPLFAYPQDHGFAISALTEHITAEYGKNLKSVNAETRLIDSFVVIKYQLFDKINQKTHTGDCRFKRLSNGRYDGKTFSCKKTGVKKNGTNTSFSAEDNITPLILKAIKGTHYDYEQARDTFKSFYRELVATHPSISFLPIKKLFIHPDSFSKLTIPGFQIDLLIVNFTSLSVNPSIELQYTLNSNNESGKCMFDFSKGFINKLKSVSCTKN